MNIVVVGHVDHGKSTVIGHLLADTDSLPKGKLDAIRESCKRNSKPFEYAFLLDALKNEQSQGITIDTCRCFFKTEKRRYIIIDAPGHIEFLKNMVTGASRAEAALMVIDASHGVEENTRRHGYYLSMLGIRQIAVLVNKMDLIGYDQNKYETICQEYTAFLKEIGIVPKTFIPVSARVGDNIAAPSAEMPWYQGMTVLQALDSFENIQPSHQLPFRMSVQGVYKFTAGGDSRRIIAGTVDSGVLHTGDEVVFYPSGKHTRVKDFEVFNAAPPRGSAGGRGRGLHHGRGNLCLPRRNRLPRRGKCTSCGCALPGKPVLAGPGKTPPRKGISLQMRHPEASHALAASGTGDQRLKPELRGPAVGREKRGGRVHIPACFPRSL